MLTARKLIPGELATIPRSTKRLWAEWYGGGGRWKGKGPACLYEYGLIGKRADGSWDVTPDEVTEMLDDGRLQIEAVTYKCESFNRPFYDALVRELDRQRAANVYLKRERSDDEDEDADADRGADTRPPRRRIRS